MISVYYCLRAGHFSQKLLVESKHCNPGSPLPQTNTSGSNLIFSLACKCYKLCVWRSPKGWFSTYTKLHRTHGIRKDHFIPWGLILLPLKSVAEASLIAVSTCWGQPGELTLWKSGTGRIALADAVCCYFFKEYTGKWKICQSIFFFTTAIRKPGSVLRRPMTVCWCVAQTNPWRSFVPLLVQKH